MKNLLFCILFIIYQTYTFSQELQGVWKGKIHVQGVTLNIVFNIEKSGDTHTVKMDSPDQKAYGIEAKKTTYINDTLSVEFPQMMAKYIGKFEVGIANDMFIGDWYQGGSKFELFFSKDLNAIPTKINRPQTPKPPFKYLIEEVTFRNEQAEINLSGTLTIPKGAGPFRCVILVTGSGPQDRNEELFNHKPFWVIADYLTNQGIAVLRYDERGVGVSEGVFDTATSEDFANDAESAFMFLKKDQRIDRKKIGIAGHSEGAMIAQIIAARNQNLGFIISLAGPGISIPELLLEQQLRMHVAEGGNAKDIENETALNAQIFYAIKNYDVEIAKKMVEKYMDEFELTLNDEKLEEFKRSRDSIKQSVFTPWFVYFIKFEAEKYLSKIKCPVLALNGEKDTQVIADSNLKAIALILKNSGNKNVKTIKFENLNHLFQTAKTGGFSEYGEIEETFSPAVLKVMGEWILSLK